MFRNNSDALVVIMSAPYYNPVFISGVLLSKYGKVEITKDYCQISN